MNMSLYVYMHVRAGAYGSQKMASDLQELE